MRRTVFLSAGESSGDLHGAALARALLRRDPELRLVGLGGRRMEEAGVRRLAGLEQLAVMGFAEVVRRLPFFFRLRRRVWRFLEEQPPDLVVPIDYPGFNLPLAEQASARGIRVLYYIAPQVWAWREGRARRLARACELVCVILPFEEELLKRYGARARFVGHPLLDANEETSDGSGQGSGEPEGASGSGDEVPGGTQRTLPPVLGLFPGSRAQEVARILPPFLDAADRIRNRLPHVRVRVARAPEVEEALYRRVPTEELLPVDQVLRQADAALTKSGTVTLQLALAGVPMVVAYRMNPITFRIARRLVGVKHIALANLVAGRRVVPELVQDEMTPEALSTQALPLLEEGNPEREAVRRGLTEVRERLGEPGCAERVAEHALELMSRSSIRER